MTAVPGSPHTPSYGEVDLTTCDREPIHVPGAIQPHGVLVAVDGPLVIPEPDDDTTLLAVRLAP